MHCATRAWAKMARLWYSHLSPALCCEVSPPPSSRQVQLRITQALAKGMTRKRVDQDKLLRLHASASVTVGSDDSLIFFRPSRMHRRMRAEVGPRVLRKLATRPLAKCEQIATAQERAQDIMMTELTRLRIKPEKKKRAHDDRERLALRVLATTIDTTRTFTQFDKEIGSIDHVTEPPALDEALQARQDTDARERTQRMRQFVQEHVDKMPLQVLRVGDHIEIGISGVASLKQLKTLEKQEKRKKNARTGRNAKARKPRTCENTRNTQTTRETL